MREGENTLGLNGANGDQERADEGCNVAGYIVVPRAKGNIHFAPHSGFKFIVVDNFINFAKEAFNASHYVNHFSFDSDRSTDAPVDIKSPLEHAERIVAEGSGLFQYFLKVVPSEYVYADGRTVLANQYAATEHYVPLSNDKGRNPLLDASLPGYFSTTKYRACARAFKRARPPPLDISSPTPAASLAASSPY